MANEFKPFVPADSSLKELSIKAIVLGVIMAVVLGAANAYLGMKAGLTVAATFPAAVVAPISPPDCRAAKAVSDPPSIFP